MQPVLPTKSAPPGAPSFYLTGRHPLRPGVLLLATLAAAGTLSLIVYGLSHRGHVPVGADAASSSGASPRDASATEDKDDPSQIDTIVLGDPADAPVPGRRGNHVSNVHPTIVVHLPRFGDQAGLIPDTIAGHFLYMWLAAFNQASAPALGSALPSVATTPATLAQMELRRQTGGFQLLSAKEVEPGVLVFRLRDQTPLATEALGALQVRSDFGPASVATFSLRAVLPADQHATQAVPMPGALPR